jgi:hypothetical protein
MSDRKQEILNAAVAIADELGLEAVSMRSVADRVGVTPMALYPHVGSKGALLDAMVECPRAIRGTSGCTAWPMRPARCPAGTHGRAS